jgi:hypothetical protein
MLFPLENICWLCLKPFPPESEPDEFGFFVHEACRPLAKKKEAPKTG